MIGAATQALKRTGREQDARGVGPSLSCDGYDPLVTHGDSLGLRQEHAATPLGSDAFGSTYCNGESSLTEDPLQLRFCDPLGVSSKLRPPTHSAYRPNPAPITGSARGHCAAVAQWVNDGPSDPIRSPARRGGLSGELDDEAAGEDARIGLRHPGGLLKRRPLHADLGTDPSQSARAQSTGWRGDPFSNLPSVSHGSDLDWQWQGLSHGSSGMDGSRQSCFQTSPSASGRESGLQGEAGLPSPLRRHPWAWTRDQTPLHGKQTDPQKRPTASLPASTGLIESSGLFTSPPDASSEGLTSWLGSPERLHHQPAGPSASGSLSNQLSLRHAGRFHSRSPAAAPSALDSREAAESLGLEAVAAAAQAPLGAPVLPTVRPLSGNGHGASGGSSEDDTGPQGPQDFHSLAHIHRYARLADRAVGRVASQQPMQNLPGLQGPAREQAIPANELHMSPSCSTPGIQGVLAIPPQSRGHVPLEEGSPAGKRLGSRLAPDPAGKADRGPKPRITKQACLGAVPVKRAFEPPRASTQGRAAKVALGTKRRTGTAPVFGQFACGQ